MTTQPVQVRQCKSCWQSKPVTEFRFRDRQRGVRHSECKACHSLSTTQRAARKRRKKICGIARVMGWSSTPPSEVEALASKLVAAFGGINRLVAVWHEAFEHTRGESNHRLVLVHLRAIMRLLELVDSRRTPLDQLPDEELQAVVMQSVERLARQRPELMLACAEQLGWQVIRQEASVEV